ncbi:hypothetical protein AAY473_020059, partial [Plecturocebus cupreus]
MEPITGKSGSCFRQRHRAPLGLKAWVSVSLAQADSSSCRFFLASWYTRFCSCCPGWSAMGAILAHCNLCLLGSKTRFCHVGRTGLKLLTSNDSLASASQSIGITGVSHCARSKVIFKKQKQLSKLFLLIFENLENIKKLKWNLALLPRLECSGTISAQYNLCLLSSTWSISVRNLVSAILTISLQADFWMTPERGTLNTGYVETIHARACKLHQLAGHARQVTHLASENSSASELVLSASVESLHGYSQELLLPLDAPWRPPSTEWWRQDFYRGEWNSDREDYETPLKAFGSQCTEGQKTNGFSSLAGTGKEAPENLLSGEVERRHLE